MSTSPAAHALKSGHGQMKKMAQFKKYTVQPRGFWARISRFLAIDPQRSTGIPLNPQYRNPPPGALDPATYDDPITVPAADLAENPYWKRDMRRRYPRISVLKQGDVVALLTVGSKANPKDEVLQIGDAGAKQLVAVKEEAEKGLAAYLKKEKGVASSVLGPDGMPPLPTGLSLHEGVKKYGILKEQSYGTDYPCRTFE
ncbi:hypothetical protein H2201_004778 [Coniosporium apollinis]|uniref:NADH dehydrogenase n=1 Tax=Coniosporium apollinis TaxID=61459 RepID=A0ABQ9NTU6_9PEZI|nr:hypothetical protein H2201_004778 [Coniosporium apollinis]